MVHLPPTRPDLTALTDGARRGLWITLLTGASVAFSLIFACATPFAALATLAVRNMRRRDAFLLAIPVWLANQAVGYGILQYPHTLDSIAWGGAIGVAALLATTAAMAVGDQPLKTGPVLATMIAFAAAFGAYEIVLCAVAVVLPTGDEAFSPHIVVYVLQVNVVALAGLYLLGRLAPIAGLPRSRWQGARFAAIDRAGT